MHTSTYKIALFGAVLLLIGAGCSGATKTENTAPEPTTSTYENTEYHFTMTYPKKWEMQEPATGPTVIFFSPLGEQDQFSENVNILIQNLGEKFTLDEYTDASIKALQNGLPDFTLVESERVAIGDVPAQRITYTGTYEGAPLKWKQWIFLKGSHDYIATYTGEQDQFDASAAEATDIVESLRFTE